MRRGLRETIRRRPDYERDPEWGNGELFPSRKKPVKKNPLATDEAELAPEDFVEDKIERDS
jgi:hypothetical protein